MFLELSNSRLRSSGKTSDGEILICVSQGCGPSRNIHLNFVREARLEVKGQHNTQ
jgi:hypothetical protein